MKLPTKDKSPLTFGGKPTTSNFSSHYIPTPTQNPNTMEVDVIKISKLTSKEKIHCQTESECYCCREKDHLSNQCPCFSRPPKKVQHVQKPVNTWETKDEASLIELEDKENQATVRKIDFYVL